MHDQHGRIRITGGILIAVEGIDGAGKTTQAAAIAERLGAVGFEVIRTKEPTGGAWGRLLRGSAATGRLSADEELDAFVNDRVEHVAAVIGPALARGAVVIVDRYYFSTVAYQGARGLDAVQIQSRNEAIAPVPDVLVLLRTDASVGVARIRARGDVANHFEREEDLRRVGAIFETIRSPGLLALDGHLPAPQLTEQILERVVLGPLFERLCLLKPRPTACEPVACQYRRTGECNWVKVSIAAPVVDDHVGAINAIAQDPTLSPEQKVSLALSVMGSAR